jgi:hypothetical protein
MLPSEGLSWATLASLVLGVSCANDFVTNDSSPKSFPSEFEAGTRTKIDWTNITGFIAGIYVYGNGLGHDPADATWVLGQSTPFTQRFPVSPSLTHHLITQHPLVKVPKLTCDPPPPLQPRTA